MKHRCSRVCARSRQLPGGCKPEALTGTRVIVDFGSHCKITIHLGTFSINYDNPQACSLRLVLSELGIGVISLEGLNLLEIRRFLSRAHFTVFRGLLQHLEKVDETTDEMCNDILRFTLPDTGACKKRRFAGQGGLCALPD